MGYSVINPDMGLSFQFMAAKIGGYRKDIFLHVALCFVNQPSWGKFTPLAQLFSLKRLLLTLKHRETHGCVVSTVATDALVLKHQAISIHNAD